MEGYNLNTVLKRLEAATSRLEDVLVYQSIQHKPSASNASNQPSQVSPSSASATAQTGSPTSLRNAGNRASVSTLQPNQSASLSAPGGGQSAPGAGVSNDQVAAPQHHRESIGLLSPRTSVGSVPRYPAALGAISLSDFLAQSANFAKELDCELIDRQAHAFESAWNAMTGIVTRAASMPMPEFDELAEILKPMNEAAGKVDQIRAECRDQVAGNFLATVLAGVPALGWVSMPNEAPQFIQEMIDSAMFYANRVLKDNRDAKVWVDSYTQILKSLQGVVKMLKSPWNTNPSVSLAALSPASATPAPTLVSSGAGAGAGGAGGPPPPPPPPSVSQLTASLDATVTPQPQSQPQSQTQPQGGGLSGVFAELNQGTSIASGLKKTDKAALKNEKPPIPKSSKPKPSSAPKPKPKATAQPKIELVDTKWIIEDVVDNHDISINAEMGQSVQIDNCQNCTIQIHGKCATFNMSRCSNVGLLSENMVASCDIVKCQSFGLQITGTLPSLMIDQSHQGSIYLSKESLDIDIFTSQTSAINVNTPGDLPGEFTEHPLAEQIVHNIKNDKVVSTVVKHA